MTRHNISHSIIHSILITLINLSLFLGCGSAIAANNLPDIGNSAEMFLSPEDEKRIGQEFMRQVRYALHLEDDNSSNEYIQNLGNKLASQIDTRGQSFTFFIVSDSTVNAFAGPGGYIGVHTGLILAAKTEGELASVMAHEIAHVVQQHLLRSLESSQNTSLATFGAIVAAMLLGGEAGEAILATTLATSATQQLSYSRAHEQEADRVGIDMLGRAGFDPNDMPNFFATLQRQNRFSQQNIPELLLTHPVTSSRIADTRGRATAITKSIKNSSGLKPAQKKRLSIASQFELIQSRLKIISRGHGRVTQLAFNQNSVISENRKTNHVQLYKEALGYTQLEKYKKARTRLSKLLSAEPQRIAYLIASAENEIADKKYKSAIYILNEPILVYPNNISLTLLFANALLLNKEPQRALKILQNLIRSGHYTPQAYKMLAKAAKQSGYESRAYEALGTYYYSLREINTAIKHFEQALEITGNDNFRKIQLKARIAQLKGELVKLRTGGDNH